MATEENPILGWGWAFNARAAHCYTADGHSLCRRVFVLGISRIAFGDSWEPQCKGCERKVAKIAEREEAARLENDPETP